MRKIGKEIEALRRRIEASNNSATHSMDTNRLAVTEIRGRFDLDLYCNPSDDVFNEFLSSIARREIAVTLRSVILRGPDEGANGTRNWHLEPLLAHDAEFSCLEFLSVERTRTEHHNRSIVGEYYDEEGVLGRLLAKMPRLSSLESPSAPDKSFFAVGPRPLTNLCIDAGYDTQDFIRNLAQSTAFSGLQLLDWREYNETYMDDWRDECTPLEDYRAMFSAPHMANVFIKWHDPACTPEEIESLQRLRSTGLLQVIRTKADYVRLD